MRSLGDARGGDGVHLAFDTELGRLAVDAMPARRGEVDVEGLVLRTDPDVRGIDLTFFERGVLRRAARVGPDGQFDVRGVPVGVDELRLTAESTRVRL